MMKLGFLIVAMLMAKLVYGEILTGEVSAAPAPSPIQHSSPPQSETEMSPSPTMFGDNPSPSPSQLPEASDVTTTKRSSEGGNKAGITVAAIAAASMVGVCGYLLKKRRENIRRSRYEYAATEII